MPDLVYMKGGRVTAGEVVGQGCLAEVTNTTEDWIFDDQSAAASEAAAGVGADTYYPVGLSDVDELMELYWRWKTPRADWTMPEGSFTTGGASHTLSGEMTTGGSETTREAEMVLPSMLSVEKDLDVYEPVEDQRDFGVYIRVFEDGGGPMVKFYNNKYYPRFSIVIWELYDDDEGFYYMDNYMGTFADDPEFGNTGSSFTGTLSLSSGDYNIPMYVLYASGEDFTLDCTEYWAHKKPDGTAKWNTSTGLPV